MIPLIFLAADATLLPPLRFQENNGAHIVFATPDQLALRCKDRHHESKETRVARACADRVGGEWVIFAPNPCVVPQVWGEYAGWLCHELGHVNGWTEAHEQ